MNINFNAFFRVIGLATFLMSGAMVIPLIVAIYYNEATSIQAFLCTIFFCVSIGIIIKKFLKPSEKTMTMRDSFFIVPIFWILASAISASPFVMQGCIPNPIHAFFETTSGLTTTGSSILKDVECLPKSMLYWRSFTHWLGGMGILIFMLALLPSIGMKGNALAAAESPGPTMDKLTPKISDSAKNLYKMYTVFTAIMIVILMLCGMNFFDASTHAFGSIGTGGFGIYNNSIAHYKSPLIEWIIAGFMIFSGINFNLYYYALTKKNGYKILLKDEEFRFYIIIILLEEMVENGVYEDVEANYYYTSGMLRANQTMNVIFGDVRREIISNLAERAFGLFEKQSHEELLSNPDYIRWINENTETENPGGVESMTQFRERIRKGFNELLDMHSKRRYQKMAADRNSVCVCHAGSISVIIMYLFDPDCKNFYSYTPDTGRGYVLEIENGKPISYSQL